MPGFDDEARQLRESLKRHLISALDVFESALRARAVAQQRMQENREDLDTLRRIPAETWAKILYEATTMHRPEGYVEWAQSPERPLYRTLGAAVVAELCRRIRAPLPPALPAPESVTETESLGT